MTDIGFTVPAGLMGLEALNKFPTTIVSVDVVGGNHDAVILIIKGELSLALSTAYEFTDFSVCRFSRTHQSFEY